MSQSPHSSLFSLAKAEAEFDYEQARQAAESASPQGQEEDDHHPCRPGAWLPGANYTKEDMTRSPRGGVMPDRRAAWLMGHEHPAHSTEDTRCVSKSSPKRQNMNLMTALWPYESFRFATRDSRLATQVSAPLASAKV